MKAQTNLEKNYILINKENGARIRYNGASNSKDTIEREIQLIFGRNADNNNRI